MVEAGLEKTDRALRREWDDGTNAYLTQLINSVGVFVVDWCHENPNARGQATAAGVGQLLRNSRYIADRIDDTSDYARRAALAAEAIHDQQRGVVAASVAATIAGSVVGDAVGSSDPAVLGVHGTITVARSDATGLTPYIPRDITLRERLVGLTQPDARSEFVIAVGTSCAGKTRGLYEAVREVLPDWQLIAPGPPPTCCSTCKLGFPGTR